MRAEIVAEHVLRRRHDGPCGASPKCELTLVALLLGGSDSAQASEHCNRIGKGREGKGREGKERKPAMPMLEACGVPGMRVVDFKSLCTGVSCTENESVTRIRQTCVCRCIGAVNES